MGPAFEAIISRQDLSSYGVRSDKLWIIVADQYISTTDLGNVPVIAHGELLSCSSCHLPICRLIFYFQETHAFVFYSPQTRKLWLACKRFWRVAMHDRATSTRTSAQRRKAIRSHTGKSRLRHLLSNNGSHEDGQALFPTMRDSQYSVTDKDIGRKLWRRVAFGQ